MLDAFASSRSLVTLAAIARGGKTSALRSTRLGYVSGLEGLVPDYQRPRDPCVFVGEGDGGDVDRAPRQKIA
jgi:hypothetical protein